MSTISQELHRPEEAVGAAFSPAAMLEAQRRSWACVEEIRRSVVVGMSEAEAVAMARDVVKASGADKQWHFPKIRFDEGTLLTFADPAHPTARWSESSVMFIDLGPVYGGIEGDVGATFAGPVASAQKKRVTTDVKEIFDEVAAHWRTTGATGQALYALAFAAAARRGWVLNRDIKGHRVSEFPHKVHYKGNLGDQDYQPAPDLWILEIQLRHPTENWGAFYEDLLSTHGNC